MRAYLVPRVAPVLVQAHGLLRAHVQVGHGVAGADVTAGVDAARAGAERSYAQVVLKWVRIDHEWCRRESGSGIWNLDVGEDWKVGG